MMDKNVRYPIIQRLALTLRYIRNIRLANSKEPE